MTATERFTALPRVVRWLLWAVLGLGAYYFVIEKVVEKTSALNALATIKADRLARIEAGAAALDSAQSGVNAGVQRFGLVALPGDAKERSEAFSKRVAEILHARSVHDHTSTVKDTPLGAGPLLASVGADYRIDRLVTELQFDASPETVAAVLADLERAPEVTCVSRVQVRKATAQGGKSGGRMLKTTIAAEVWQLVRKAKTR